MAVQLRAASRETLAEAETGLDSRVQSSSVTELGTLGEELFALERLLVGEPTLRRYLTDSSVPGRNRSGLADQLFGGQVGRATLDTVSELAAGRWSRPIDLVEVLQVLARRATIAVAEKDGSLSEVEDELFRFGRILNREPALSALLADTTTPADGRVALLDQVLLDQVLGQKVRPVTKALLEQTVRTSRDHNLDLAAEELSELAAARRDRYVAHVGTPVALTAQQEQQLTDTLSRLYGRQMSVQLEFDPELLGGLVVRVGGEVIDGSVSSRLSAAKRALPK
jgi:F-type H+-transporting ATPase subunit delta